MSRRYHYRAMRWDEFAYALDLIGWVDHTFDKVTGVNPSTRQAWRKGDKTIPPWVPVFLEAMTVPKALVKAKNISARMIFEDTQAPGVESPMLDQDGHRRGR